MSNDVNELRWDSIQSTRRRDPNTQEAVPGSPGYAFMRWQNGLVDRVLVLTRDRNYNVEIQRTVGGQRLTVKLDSLRTESELLSFLKKKYPEHVPASKPARFGGQMPVFNPSRLPRQIVDEAWGVK